VNKSSDFWWGLIQLVLGMLVCGDCVLVLSRAVEQEVAVVTFRGSL
jgi:hypothetical protein